MKLWMAYSTFGLSLCLIAALVLAGCVGETPSGPSVDARGNTGTITTNISTGSSSPIGTAPCGASSGQKGNGLPVQPDCSSTVTNPPPEEPEAAP